jgi:hypothetical protein
MAEACTRLWREPALRDRIVENARQMVRNDYTAAAFARRCENALAECIALWSSL